MRKKNSVLVGFGQEPKANKVKLIDKLTIYFQKESVSGDNDVINIELQTDNPAALVTFENDEAVDKVLSCKNHVVYIDGQQITLHVEPFSMEVQAPIAIKDDDVNMDSWEVLPEVLSDDDLYSSSLVHPSPLFPRNAQNEESCLPVHNSSTKDRSHEEFVCEDQSNKNKGYEEVNVKLHLPQPLSEKYDGDDQSNTVNYLLPTYKRSGAPRMPRAEIQDNLISSADFDSGAGELKHCSTFTSFPKRHRGMDDKPIIEKKKQSQNGRQQNAIRGGIENMLVRNSEQPEPATCTSIESSGNSGYDDNFENRKSIVSQQQRSQGSNGKPRQYDSRESAPKLQTHHVQEDVIPSATVEVSQFNPTTEINSIAMYFENTWKSSGGKIADCTVNEDRVVISFEDPSVAQAVLTRKHTLDGATLTVQPMIKTTPQAQCRPVDRQRLLLTGIPDGTNKEECLLFVEGRTKVDEDPEIVYGELPGTAMLRYSKEIKDIEQVTEYFKMRKLQKKTVCASLVEYTDCVLVKNLPPDITEDTVELYFESVRKSDGGRVNEVRLDKVKNQAVVYFEDWKVVDKVLRRKHELCKATLNVSEYFDKLGVIVSTDGPTPHIYEAVSNDDFYSSSQIQGRPSPASQNEESMHVLNKGHRTPSSNSQTHLGRHRNYDDNFEGCENQGSGVRNVQESSRKQYQHDNSGLAPQQRSHRSQEYALNVNLEQDTFIQQHTLDTPEGNSNTTVEVSQFNSSTSDETITMYFENKRRSGGGKIAKHSVNKNIVTITFEDPSVAETVVRRTHKLEGATLTVIPAKKKKVPTATLR